MTVGLKAEISAKDRDQLLGLAVDALSRISGPELKNHLLRTGDLNDVQSPVGVLRWRLRNLSQSSSSGQMSAASVAPKSAPEPAVPDDRTDEEKAKAAKEAKAAREEARRMIKEAQRRKGSGGPTRLFAEE